MPRAKERDGVYQRSDRAGWWVSYMNASGERVRQKVAASTRRQALDALSAIRVQEERARTLGVRPASEITTAVLLDRFKRHQKSRLRSTTYERLNGILVTLGAHLPVQAKAITRRAEADYIETRAETVKPGTVIKEVSTLKHCLRLAVEWGLLHENAAAGARLPKMSEGRTRYLTPGELRAALEVAPEWMRAPMVFAACTGVRRGELLSLKWMDVDYPNRRLYLRETKNGALRILPLSDAAIKVLRALPSGKAGDPVFAGVDGQKLSVYTRRLFQSLGIMDASFHTLRHTAASWLVQQGVNLYTVGQLLGHKTPRMTQRYAHLSPDYMAGAVGKLDGVMRGVMAKQNRSVQILPAPGGQRRASNAVRLVTVESPGKMPMLRATA
jgi:integrase